MTKFRFVREDNFAGVAGSTRWSTERFDEEAGRWVYVGGSLSADETVARERFATATYLPPAVVVIEERNVPKESAEPGGHWI